MEEVEDSIERYRAPGMWEFEFVRMCVCRGKHGQHNMELVFISFYLWSTQLDVFAWESLLNNFVFYLSSNSKNFVSEEFRQKLSEKRIQIFISFFY